MTDNEIIKALECCNSEKESLCFECPYHLCSPACLTRRNTDIIDLINLQKAEIELLNKTIACKRNQIDGLTKLLKRADEIKVDAIKEFAERLKENTVTVKIGKQICKVITINGINYLVKEMIGE